jgi:hypothetical protein
MTKATWDFMGRFSNVENPTDEWIWRRLREERNKRLAACDWTVLPDSPVDVQAWSEYRQALRDLPANTTDPKLAIFPTKPE